MSKRSAILVTALLSVAACVAVYGVSRYLRPEPTDVLFEKEIDSVGTIRINHDRTMSFDKLAKVMKIIHKYSAECKKLDKSNNKLQRQSMLKTRDFSGYTYAVIEGYATEKESEQYIKSIVFDRLAINQEVFDASIRKYRSDPKYGSMVRSCKELERSPKTVSGETARKIAEEKQKLEAEVDVRRYVPEELERECELTMGSDWRETVKRCVIEDTLYEKYGLDAKEIEWNLRKHNLLAH